MKSFITVNEACELLKSEENVLFIDTRYDFKKDESYNLEIFQNNHIKDAIFINIEKELSGPQTPTTGRHPLPTLEKFKETLEKNSISKDLHIICYDNTNGAYAARLWFMLYTLGFESVQILEGGYAMWLERDYPTSTGSVQNNKLKKTLNLPISWKNGKIKLVDYEEVEELVKSGFTGLVDARDPPRFRGEIAGLDPVGGHIPGASNRWWKANLSEEGMLRDYKELKKEFDLLFIEHKPAESVLYCGSGVTACFNLAVMKQLGYSEEPKLYPGSFSDWIAHTNNVETK